MSKCDSRWFCVTGIDEQGLYRIVGVSSRVQKLLGLVMGENQHSAAGGHVVLMKPGD